jgi:ligand-binding sensor domain-containing protein
MKIRIFLYFILILATAQAQILKKNGFYLNNSEGSADYILGNGIVDILTKGSQVWAATGFGLNRTFDTGATWTAFTSGDYTGKGGITALNFMDDSTLWIASSFDTITSDAGTLPAGSGLSYTRDWGESWYHIAQPVDKRNITVYTPNPTVVQNLTFDIAFLDSTIRITSWGGGLRKSSDMGHTWQVVTTDGIPFNVTQSNPNWRNHVAFSVMVENGNLWVGTADGISKSSDGGATWRRFTHQNQQFAISGNFVVALGYQSRRWW